ncbi:cation:proton antiporter [Vibrio sp. MA40-2]|uniref:cation:proton antiporter domain-containing protein n=1 Tax=Vibrio sp. MA40-2 TaxID=3391828 RepID=UPI0039A4DD3D
MDILLISASFIMGFIALRCNLPPLVGFLLAGFILKFSGFESNENIELLSDLGVTLLLFTIGLKLDIKTLLSKEIWAGATLHNVLSTLFFTLCIVALKFIGVISFSAMTFSQILLLSFALSFSSTVFAVKHLEEKGEMNTTYGTLAIGILIMQDILAVLFLTISTGKVPEWYAISLFALPMLRPFFYRLLHWVGHGEMLVIFGIFMALVVGAGLFDVVGLKPDLGALILGLLLAGHKKSSELSKSLFNLKELFLVCFFLNIGLAEYPTVSGTITALILLLLLPIKGAIYYLILNRFKFRLRTSLLTSLSLFNYSEFGLIVGGLAFKMGWLPGDILVSIAIAVSLSFMISAPLNRFGNSVYQRSSKWLQEQTPENLNQMDRPIKAGTAQILILGMGRIGTGAYDELIKQHGEIVLGVELHPDAAIEHRKEGRNVICGDAVDPDFWEHILDSGKIQLVLFAMPNHHGNELAFNQLKSKYYAGKSAAIASYPDQVETLKDLGVNAAFNIYNEAGSGFAQHVIDHLKPEFKQ